MLIIFFILGLIAGSFLNVLVYRLRVAQNVVWGRSKCPHCEHEIRWYDNIPVLSFILLRARCRDCREKISWQYPLIEILTAVLFTAIGANFFVSTDTFSWIKTVYYLGIISSLVVILVYDMLYMEIPMSVLWASIFAAVAFNLYFDWWTFSIFPGFGLLDSGIYSGILAAFLSFLFFYTLSAVSGEKWMGMGDSYLAALIGLVLGWPAVILAVFLAFLIGSVFGIMLLGMGRKNMKSQIPFAPFLVTGTIIAIFYAEPIISWYWGMLG